MKSEFNNIPIFCNYLSREKEAYNGKEKKLTISIFTEDWRIFPLICLYPIMMYTLCYSDIFLVNRKYLSVTHMKFSFSTISLFEFHERRNYAFELYVHYFQ